MAQQINYHYLLIVLLVIGLASIFSSGTITGEAFYRDSGYGYGGYGGGFFGFGGYGFNFQDLYSQYGSFIDAILFLLIFLGVGKGIFKKHFGDGGTAAYTGIGLFLAFSLLLWEQRTGFYLLEQFGPLVLTLFIVIIFLWAFKLLNSTGLHLVPTICLVYLVFYFFLIFWFDTLFSQKITGALGSGGISGFGRGIGQFLVGEVGTVIAFIAGVVLLISVGSALWGKVRKKT